MVAQAITMSSMAKKPARDLGDGSDRHRNPVLGLRLSGDVVRLMREIARRNRRPLTTEVTIALEEYLAKNGLWPPPDGDSD